MQSCMEMNYSEQIHKIKTFSTNMQSSTEMNLEMNFDYELWKTLK
jgi:hypothetical protein